MFKKIKIKYLKPIEAKEIKAEVICYNALKEMETRSKNDD